MRIFQQGIDLVYEEHNWALGYWLTSESGLRREPQKGRTGDGSQRRNLSEKDRAGSRWPAI